MSNCLVRAIWFFVISELFYQSTNNLLLVHFKIWQWGVPKIHVVCVIASEVGIQSLLRAHPSTCMTIGEVDSEINDEGFILPGLGDAGDRLYRTPMIDDEEALLHESKRSRSRSNSLS